MINFTNFVLKVLSSSTLHRSKRGYIRLCEVVEYYTKVNCLTFVGYGCYCGLVRGGTPQDEIDR